MCESGIALTIGTDVKSLIQEVKASNNQDEADGTGRKITITLSGTGVTTKENPSTGDIQSAGKYTVSVPDADGYDSAGYIKKITVEKK